MTQGGIIITTTKGDHLVANAIIVGRRITNKLSVELGLTTWNIIVKWIAKAKIVNLKETMKQIEIPKLIEGKSTSTNHPTVNITLEQISTIKWSI